MLDEIEIANTGSTGTVRPISRGTWGSVTGAWPSAPSGPHDLERVLEFGEKLGITDRADRGRAGNAGVSGRSGTI